MPCSSTSRRQANVGTTYSTFGAGGGAALGIHVTWRAPVTLMFASVGTRSPPISVVNSCTGKELAEARGRVEPVLDAAVARVVKLVRLRRDAVMAAAAVDGDHVRRGDAVLGRSGRDAVGPVVLGPGDSSPGRRHRAGDDRSGPCRPRRIVAGLVPLAIEVEPVGAVDAAAYLRERESRRLPGTHDRVSTTPRTAGSSSGRCTACTASTTVHGVSIQCWPESARLALRILIGRRQPLEHAEQRQRVGGERHRQAQPGPHGLGQRHAQAMRRGIVVGRFERVVVDLDRERPRVGPLTARVQGDANELGVRDVRVIEHPYGDFGRQRIRQVGERAPALVDREPRVCEGAVSSGPCVSSFSSRIAADGSRGSTSFWLASRSKRLASSLPPASSLPCCSASRTLTRGGAATRCATWEVGTTLSAAVSLKLRMAMRFIDSPSSGRSMVPDRDKQRDHGRRDRLVAQVRAAHASSAARCRSRAPAEPANCRRGPRRARESSTSVRTAAAAAIP